jgi:hypothetical protein
MKCALWVVLSFCGGVVGMLAAPRFGINPRAGFLMTAAAVALLRVFIAPDSFVGTPEASVDPDALESLGSEPGMPQVLGTWARSVLDTVRQT